MSCNRGRALSVVKTLLENIKNNILHFAYILYVAVVVIKYNIMFEAFARKIKIKLFKTSWNSSYIIYKWPCHGQEITGVRFKPIKISWPVTEKIIITVRHYSKTRTPFTATLLLLLLLLLLYCVQFVFAI